MTGSPELTELDPQRTPKSVLRALRQMGLSEGDLIKAINSSERSIRRWMSGGGEPAKEAAERIDDLRAIVRVLGETFPPRSVVAWLRNRNRYLDNRRPLDVLAEPDGYEKVEMAMAAILSGDYD